MNTCAHRIYPTSEDNILNSDRAAPIAGTTKVYELDVAYLIVREIQDKAMGTDTILAFHYLLT